jgi:2'-5' RNA ligase
MSVFRSKKQTVLYADVKSTRKLTHLCAEVTDALEPLGFDFGTRYYKPHITLMRAPPGEKVEAFASRHGSKLKASWQAGSFYLLKSSRPENNANRYRELARYELS